MATRVDVFIHLMNDNLSIHAQHLRPSMAALQDTPVCTYCALVAALC